ncbi:primosomal protein N' [Microbacterium invictum]|uniref:Probable replication restart protein PriA n=1 Tax=Microbacterium invictum TaxID=515415 RepID=A0ABZ0V8R5_9MICO|nr:primosomal protein N' [Microbacterium invictum]WQB68960.1 primosomal protein N' [Microbacterium invictum]
MSGVRVVRVLIDSPLPQLDRLFDYAVPPALAGEVAAGIRIKVPLRSAGRVVDAYVVEVDNEPDVGERPLSEIDTVVSSVPVLPEGLYRLARRAADRAAGSASDILRLVIPKRMVRAEKAWLAGEGAVPTIVSGDAAEHARATLGAFPGLREAIRAAERLAVDAPPHPVLTSAGEVGGWADLLAAAAVDTLAAGRSAVVVVPDHRDQAQIERALAARVDDAAIVRDDARRSGPVRYAGFLRMLADTPCIVVGNRSAVYAPVHRVGLVAIWDDGDPLLTEPLSPGVHARDAALIRQELDGCALLFAGHTRTTDVERLVQLGFVRDIPAARRRSPRVVLSATQEGERRGVRIPSTAFRAARDALAEGPVLVQVARPGYAPVLVCAECRRPARCRHCEGPLRARSIGAVPECSWCARAARGWTCVHCGSEKVRLASSGSERTAEELGRAFPGVRIIVSDGGHQVEGVPATPALVIATRGAEPPAEGGYRAVVLLDGERMLLSDDLRIGEAALRWWSNAAALAAPDAPVHLVGVTGSVARALATWSQSAYARAELASRAPLRMPPAVRVAAVDGDAPSVETAVAALREAVPALDDDSVLGPASRPEGGMRALVRFDYRLGADVAASLRSSVVAAALRTRRSRGRAPASTGTPPTLRVRVDLPDLDL